MLLTYQYVTLLGNHLRNLRDHWVEIGINPKTASASSIPITITSIDSTSSSPSSSGGISSSQSGSGSTAISSSPTSSSSSKEEPTSTLTNTRYPTSTPSKIPTPTEKPIKSPFNSTEISSISFPMCSNLNSVPVEPNFSFCNALKSSLNFFNANRAGNLTSSDLPILYPWQSGVTTNFDSTIDKALDSNGNGILSGGFFNDGSYIKSTFALAHSITTLAWTFLEFQYNIDSCQGLKKQYLSTLRIGLDWLMAAHPNQNTIYAQCGKVGDLSKWNIPSRIYDLYNGSPKRTCWLIINENNPGSDVAHEMASAFAASHMIFSLIDSNYSIQLRTHAIELFDFGFSYPGKYSDIETSGEQILYPSSDYKDELFWASAWMYQITGKSKYLSIINNSEKSLPNFSTTTASSVIYNYDQKYSAAILFLSKNFGLFNTQTNEILNYWSLKMQKTNDGLFFIDQNGGSGGGSIRYSMGGSFLVAIWNNNQHISKQFKDTFNIDQIKIVLGNNSNDQSYICGVGFLGASTPVNLHHRASHYSVSNSISNPTLNSFPIQGALVGGPINKFDFYIDDRINFTMNQPAIDYNALLAGVLASMIVNETTPEQPDTPTTGPYTTTGTPPPYYTTTGYGSTSSKPTTSTTGYGTTGYGPTSSKPTTSTTGYGTTGYGSTSSKPTTGGTSYSTTMPSSNVGTTTSITTSTSSSPTSLVTTTGGTTSSSSTSASTTYSPSTSGGSSSASASTSSPSTNGSTTSSSSTTTTTTTTTSTSPIPTSTTIDGTSSSSTSGSTTSSPSTSGSTTISSSTTSTSSNQGGSDSVINTDSQSFGEDSSSSSISSSSKTDSNSGKNSHENNGSYSTPEQSSSSSMEEQTSTPTNTPSPTQPNPTSTQPNPTSTPTQTPISTEKPTKSPINSTETSSESFNTSNRVTQRNSLCSSIFRPYVRSEGRQLNTQNEQCLGSIYSNLGLSIQPTDYCSLYASCNGQYVTGLNINSYTSTYQFSQVDFQCFPNLLTLSLTNLKISFAFLKGPLPNGIALSFKNCSTTFNTFFNTPIHSSIVYLSIDTIPPQSLPININLSFLSKVSSFFFKLGKLDSSTENIILINDFPGGSMNKFSQISMDIYDLPPMDNVVVESLSLRSFNAPTNKGYSNINTLKNISYLYISIEQGYSDFSEFSLIPNQNNLRQLIFIGNLSPTLTGRIDLRNLLKLDLLQLMSVTENFNYQGNIPLILPETIKYFYISEGLFSVGIQEFLNAYPNISNVFILNSQIDGNFSEWKNRGYNQFSISGNRFQGTVDSSWCTTITTLYRNKITGDLPSCFACHLYSATINNSISQNFFNPIPPCTTLIPNLRFNSSSNLLSLYGDDLGFYKNDIKVTSPVAILFTPLIYSKLFYNEAFTLSNLPETLDLFFKSANKNFTLSTVEKPPLVNLVTVASSSGLLFFDGSFFNYNKSSIEIKVEDLTCLITQTTFNQISCLIQGSYNKNSIAQISISVESYYTTKLKILQTNLFAYLNQSTTVYNCSLDCNSLGGICNTLIGQCSFSCPNDCTNPLSGTCNSSTGVCNCFADFQGLDCSLPFKACTSDCSLPLSQGSCNNQTGICQCVPNYQGSNCTIPSHYITSVIPCSIDGGEVLINGWFGNNNDGTHLLSSYNIVIGILDCIVTSINETEIKCNLGAGTGTKNIKIINSINPSVVFNGKGLFNYQNPIKTCPNSCTSLNNGKCNSNTGECQCNHKFSGFDCSTPIKIIESAPPTNTSINKDTGGIELTNQDTIYEISIISLNEISIDGSIFKSHQLKGNWSNDNTTITPDSNYFKFSQKLINNTCKITFTIEEIKLKDKNFTFGTTRFKVEKDSIKLSVLIQDYQYQSSLNTLQLIFYSAVGNDTDSNSNDCNKQDTSIDTSNANNQQISNYIQISKNSKTLVGRFINQVIADSRSTFMSSTIIKDNDISSSSSSPSSSVILGLNLPHCKECLIDPDFSVLVSPDFKESCNESNKNKWFIPVVVVVPIVGCAAIVALSFVLYKKYKYNLKFIAIKLKPFKK
ncbi:hypothetical protein ACTFIY_010199 [Dictyostelium cf. discoideum]